MKLYKENIVYSSNIVVVKEEHFAFNEFPFHYHPECELILIIKGSGQRYIGDSIGEFTDGNLYFLGSHLPHTFYNKHLSADRSIHQIVVQFAPHFLGTHFFHLSPFQHIQSFLNHAARGCLFTNATQQKVAVLMKQLLHLDETEVVLQLLSILNILAKSKDYEWLSSAGYNSKHTKEATERMGRVYDYIFNHFREEISLDAIASVACLSPEAFCRYFKRNTRKTFSRFLVEVRIGNACKLLQENKLSIHQISVHCGFNNLSYFNRKFKALMQKTPAEYSQLFCQKTFPNDRYDVVNAMIN